MTLQVTGSNIQQQQPSANSSQPPVAQDRMESDQKVKVLKRALEITDKIINASLFTIATRRVHSAENLLIVMKRVTEARDFLLHVTGKSKEEIKQLIDEDENPVGSALYGLVMVEGAAYKNIMRGLKLEHERISHGNVDLKELRERVSTFKEAANLITTKNPIHGDKTALINLAEDILQKTCTRSTGS